MDLLVLLVITIWSINVIIVKLALRDAAPLTYTAVRFLIGGLILLAVVQRRLGLRWPSRDELPAITVAAFFGIAANQAAFTLALRYTTAVDVSLIIGATPLAVAVHRALTARERIGARAWTGLAIGAAGLALVVESGGGAHGSLGGDLLALLAPVSWAIYLSRLSRLLPTHNTLELSALVTMIGAFLLVPFGAVETVTSPPSITWRLLGCLAYSAILSSAFCNVAYFTAIEELGATRVAVFTYLQPFLGAVAAMLLLGETLRPAQLAGGAVVVVGVIAGRPRARALPPTPASVEPCPAGELSVEAERAGNGYVAIR